METLLYPLIGAFAVMLISLIGGISMVPSVSHSIHKALHYLPSLAAGVFLVVAFSMIEGAQHTLPFTHIALFSSLGILILVSLSYFFPETEECHDETCDNKKPNRAKAGRILTADSIHNIGDGIILVPAFAASFDLGLVVLVGVLVHEAVQELSEYFVLIESGYTRKQALLRNFASASTILPGVLIGFFATTHAYAEAAILATAAGMFFYVVLKDLIPHSLKNRELKNILRHILLFIAGVALMIGSTSLIPHTHGTPHDHHEGHSTHESV